MFLRSQERKMKNFPDLQMSPYSAHLDRWNQRKVGNASYYKQRESWFTITRVETNESKNSSCMFEAQCNKDYSMSINYCIT